MADWSILGKQLVFPAVAATVGLIALWDHRNRQRQVQAWEPVADAPADDPYKVYTRAFDVEVRGEEVPRKLQDASDDVFKGKFDWNGDIWRQRIESARRWIAEHPHAMDMAPRFAASLRSGGIADPSDVAITLLVDQSSSMKGDPMSAALAAAASLEAVVSLAGARMEILGFSTAGWDGGFARKQWVGAGRPARPGRLAALLHIVYKDHAEPVWTRASREAMLHPDILRENIDGEALEWAAGRLRAVAAGTRLLLVISDGAAADDTTVMHNGKGYLDRHLQKAIAGIEAEGGIRLGAVGLRHDVSGHYRVNRNASLESLPEDLLAVAMELLSGTSARRPATTEAA